MNDQIANMLSAIKNGYQAGLKTVVLPYSSYKESIARVFCDENYLESMKVENNSKTKQKSLIVNLKYDQKVPAMTDIKQISKQGLRVYVSSGKLPRVLSGLGIAIISTPKGVMSSKKAKKEHLGGEVICKIW